jgi:ribosomal protein S19E (S16A)
MIHLNVGNYLRQLVVNQGFTIKEFSKIYGTTEVYMGDIFQKEDVSTSVIRKMEKTLNTSFLLTSELD